MEITTHFRPKSRAVGFRIAFTPIRPIVQWLKAADTDKEWLLAGENEKESYLYPSFNENGDLTVAAEAVLETSYKGESVRTLVAWNGEKDWEHAATLAYSMYAGDWPASWNLEIDCPIRQLITGNSKPLIALLQLIARQLNPTAISVAEHPYSEHQVFQDRIGVGWMLYLPRVLTTQQVPEARALVPVMGAENKEQIGTIIASETEVPFDYKIPEHVKVANQIEIRLADQDLLPLLTDL